MQFISYLVEKYCIFTTEVELDDSNVILDENLILKIVPDKILHKARLTDSDLTKVATTVVNKFRCYRASDIDFTKQLNKTNVTNIVTEYKKYKQTPHSSVTEFELDRDLDTSNTAYIDTLSTSTESLVERFGPLVHTGTQPEDKHRYEYKYKYDKDIIISVYDWKVNNEFENVQDITWHVACNKTLTKGMNC